MRIAITADLHWGHGPAGDDATRHLRQHLDANPVDLLVLAGDLGTANHFQSVLQVFADLPCARAALPGNHDLWVEDGDVRGDSLNVYQRHLPGLCADHGFHYLDHAPLMLPEADLAVVGGINWYDYSWSLDKLKTVTPDWEWHLQEKTFSRGRHNDGRFVRWPTNDLRFTQDVVAQLKRHLQTVFAQVGKAIVITHHPPLYGLNFPRENEAMSLDALLWDAFSGNTALEAVLRQHAARVPFVFCGHTHRERECRLDGMLGFNVGGDYHFKRMLVLDWPAGTVESHVFGDPHRRR